MRTSLFIPVAQKISALGFDELFERIFAYSLIVLCEKVKWNARRSGSQLSRGQVNMAWVKIC